jgi:predicted NAD/FAD-dependent oxidoreductase
VDRRAFIATAAIAASTLAGCIRKDSVSYDGGWVGANAERGHMLRDRKSGSLPAPQSQRRAGAIVVGGGIAGLSAARALAAAGIDDVRVFELEDEAGGNSRGHVMGTMACPLGAHYLPLPGNEAIEVIELLDELGLRRVEHGRAVYDELHLCHSPQERLFIDGHWREGLLPPLDALAESERAITQLQYRQFSVAVDRAGMNSRVNVGANPGASTGAGAAFAIPTARSVWSPALDALDAVTFSSWLDSQGITAAPLRWYLDYCCRDDYGAGASQVSAWAGLHYFASRHGFRAPDGASSRNDNDDRDAVLTWPEGNAWLSRKLAAPLGERIRPASVVMSVVEARQEVNVDVWNARTKTAERWTAPHVIMATPLFISARLLATPIDALTQAVGTMRYAPWLVANLHIGDALDDKPGAPPSWDNVIYEAGPAGAMLGYVDAMHQSTRSVPGATVLTAYWALGGHNAAQLQAQRARLLSDSWQTWAAAVVQDLARAHPDLPAKLRRVDLMRYGHAMSIPVPGLRSSAALRELAASGSASAAASRRIHFAHSDLSAYSVFEEALYHGRRAAVAVGARTRATVRVAQGRAGFASSNANAKT